VIVDTHVHVVAADRERYPLSPSGITGDWFREAPASVEQFLGLIDTAGVDRAVLVQAMSAYGFDNRYVVDAARAHVGRLASVVIVDTDDEPALRLRELADRGGVTGVRLFGIGNPTLERLDDPKTFPVWELAAERDLRVVVTILPDQLGELSFMLDRYPATPVVLDHCGFPDVSGGPPFVRAEPLFALADRSNLHLKVSSHLLEQVDPVAFVTRFAAVFGADRLLWGSDFPQTHDRSYAELVELGRAACAGLPTDQQRAFLGGNALRLWPRLGR